MVLKKNWYEILAPPEFGEKVIGETLAAEPKHLVGRIVRISMAELTNNYSKFYIKLDFKIIEVEGNKCKTTIIGHTVQSDRIYRMVRRHTRKVTIINDVTTKDGSMVRVKTIMVLPHRINTSLRSTVRKKATEIIIKKAESMDYIDFIKLLISGGFIMELKKLCGKIYPVAQIEIYKSELLVKSEAAVVEKHNKERTEEAEKREEKETTIEDKRSDSKKAKIVKKELKASEKTNGANENAEEESE